MGFLIDANRRLDAPDRAPVGTLHAARLRIRAYGYLLELPDGRTLGVKWVQDALVNEHDWMLGWT